MKWSWTSKDWRTEEIPSLWKIMISERKVFLMKEHNWAFAAWEISRMRGWIQSNATLFHVDSHLDDVSDGIEVPGLLDIQTEADAIRVSTGRDGYSKESRMHYDNFIWAGFARDTIENVIFVGEEHEDGTDFADPFDLSDWDIEAIETTKALLPKGKLERYKGTRVRSIQHLVSLHEQGNLLKYTQNKSLILDLDLDYFVTQVYDEEESQYVWKMKSDGEVLDELTILRDMYQWDVLTVALSPYYCGGYEASEHLLGMFLKSFELSHEKIEKW